MPIVINGTTGISGVDGTASVPALRGTDSDSGVFLTSTGNVAISGGGTQRFLVDTTGRTTVTNLSASNVVTPIIIATTAIATGNVTAGNVTVSGTINASTILVNGVAAVTSGGFSNMEVFTANGTFTVPAGITKVKVTVVGGGGGGGGWNGSYAQNGIGGSGGGTAIKIVSGLTPGGTVSVTVGTGGAAGGTGVTSRGGTGGTSSFGAYCSATGGAGGYNASQSGGNAPAGVGGSGSSGDINLNGGGPSWGVNPGGCNEGWNIGGVSFLGTGGINNSAGTDQSPIYGGGGAGASLSGAPQSATGMQAGATGIVIVEY